MDDLDQLEKTHTDAAWSNFEERGDLSKDIAALLDAVPGLIAELRTLRARVSEADELRARAEASVASMSAEMTAARELIGVQWWLLEHPLCGSRSFMDGLRSAFEARERDARLGAVVREAAEQTGDITDVEVLRDGDLCRGGYIGTIVVTEHQFDVLRAIDSALRAERAAREAAEEVRR